MFFWYFPAEEPREPNPPLVVWLQGGIQFDLGPGSSSMIALFYEMGPFYVTEDVKLMRRPDAWSKHWNLLFIDSPVGTGYSYVQDATPPPRDAEPTLAQLIALHSQLPKGNCTPFDDTIDPPKFKNGFVTNQAAVAHDLIVFLDRFYDIFPETRNSKLYLTGESYAGKYIPSLAYHIDQVNRKRSSSTARKPIPLQGVAIGDGLTDPITQIKYHAPQALALGLASTKQAELMTQMAGMSIDFMCQQDFLNALYMRLQMFDYFKAISGDVNHYDVRLGNHPYLRTPMYQLLRNEKTLASLNLPSNLRFEKDENVYYHLKGDIMKSTAAYIPILLNQGYKVVLFQGNYDFRDGILGSNEWIDSMKWKDSDGYAAAERLVWYTHHEREQLLAGYVTRYSNLARIELLNAGHLAPGDQTFNSAEMLSQFLMD